MTTPQSTLDELFRTPPRRPNRYRPSSPLSDRPKDLERILSLIVTVAVTLAEREMPLEDILKFNVGTILEFDVSSDTELTLGIAGESIGVGHAVKVGENFGLRVTQLQSVQQRIAALGG